MILRQIDRPMANSDWETKRLPMSGVKHKAVTTSVKARSNAGNAACELDNGYEKAAIDTKLLLNCVIWISWDGNREVHRGLSMTTT
jgi:hypothetical protein